jgi:hypothetical protein
MENGNRIIGSSYGSSWPSSVALVLHLWSNTGRIIVLKEEVTLAQNSNKQKKQILQLLKSDASVYVPRKLGWLHDILKSRHLPNPGKGSFND